MVSYNLRNAMAITNIGLNPCCSGQWSRTFIFFQEQSPRIVLILVVVDNGLVQANGQQVIAVYEVLILVVVDNGLVQFNQAVFGWLQVVLILVVVDNGLVQYSPI